MEFGGCAVGRKGQSRPWKMLCQGQTASGDHARYRKELASSPEGREKGVSIGGAACKKLTERKV